MLGVPLVPEATSCFTCRCGANVKSGHHAMACPQLAGSRTWRHNFVQQTVRSVICAAGWASSIEPTERHLKNIQPGDKGYHKRGDILAAKLDEVLNIDISLIHPGADSYVHAAAKAPGAAAKIRDEQKRNDHANEGTQGYKFVSFSIECYGRLGKPAEKLLKELADCATGDRNAFLNWAHTQISLRLVKGNEAILRAFCRALPEGMGGDYINGNLEPTVE